MQIRSIILALILAGAPGCTTANQQPDVASQTGPTILEVDNRGFVDMTIYVVRNSQRIRLGTATGNQKTQLVIPPAVLGGISTLRFIADPIGGARNSVSEEISVVPGDKIGLMIPPG
jgi:hypothetical protein